jgi:tRNA A37 threonylcarbamoyladenosine modification protein TsaB
MIADRTVVLFIDTSRESALVAVARGTDIIAQRRRHMKPGVAQEVLAMVEELLAGSRLKLTQLELIATRCGPAQRTSALRAGIVVSNLLAYALGIQVVSVASENTLDALREALATRGVDFVMPLYR